MSEASCLDSLIREVDAATQAASSGQQKVAVDINRRAVVTTSWFRPAASLKYFLVSTNSMATCETSVIYLNDSDNGRAVGMKVELSTGCALDGAERMAIALCDDPNPGTVLTSKIKRWVHEFAGRQPATFLDSFPTARVQLASFLRERALADAGLDLTATISLYGEENLDRAVIYGPVELQVNLRDYDRGRQIRLRVELITAPEHLVDALAYRGDVASVNEVVEQSTREYFSEITLSHFYKNTESLSGDLRSYLNERLKVIGRTVQRLELECDNRVSFEPYEGHTEVECSLFGSLEPLVVKAVVQITIQDYGIYLGAGAPGLAAWLSETLDEIVRQTLSEKTFAEAISGLDLLARDLRNRMSFKAAAIGCGMRQQLTITSASLESWLNGFDFVTEDAFETSLENFQSRLKAFVTVALRRPEDVREYLVRGTELPKLMERSVLETIRQELLRVHPQRLYARQSDPQPGVEEPVKALLTRRIKEVLVRDFGAEVISVRVEMAGGDFGTRINELRSQTITLEVQLFSHRPQNKTAFTFSVDCRIEDISGRGWEILGPTSFRLEKIKEQLINTLKSGLETHDDLNLAYSTGEEAVKVKKEIANLIRDFALREFGVSLNVRNVRREPTEIEKKMREAALANELTRIDMLRKLEQEVLQLIANGGRDSEIAGCRKRIDDLRAYVQSQPLSSPTESWQTQTSDNVEPLSNSGALPPERLIEI